jgi:23S rRNA (uridine2552-2'-O)-methyltransferase
MSRSKSSSQWLKDHFSDPYVKRAHQDSLRSRSAYKLLEIQKKDPIIRPGMAVVDLGAAPGGWSKLAAGLVGERGKVFALDVLPMDPIAQVDFLQGDFQEPIVFQHFINLIQTRPIDLVLSDMAPNLSGMRVIDQPRIMHLAELAFDFTQHILKSRGNFVIKVFQGEGFETYLGHLRQSFAKVHIRKPPASRSTSSEVYLVALSHRKKISIFSGLK